MWKTRISVSAYYSYTFESYNHHHAAVFYFLAVGISADDNGFPPAVRPLYGRVG
jgi:hypothetical protein